MKQDTTSACSIRPNGTNVLGIKSLASVALTNENNLGIF